MFRYRISETASIAILSILVVSAKHYSYSANKQSLLLALISACNYSLSRVVGGLETLDKMEQMETDKKDDRPLVSNQLISI